MNRLLAGLGVLACGFVLGRAFEGGPAPAVADAAVADAAGAGPAGARGGGGQAEGEVECTAQNGDINADAKINLTDAVTILTHLFQGSPGALVPQCVETTPEPEAGSLPDTGLAKCYSSGGAEVPCGNANCPVQDADVASGCPGEGRFVDNGDGTVTDTCTGLTWQQATADTNGDGRRSDADAIAWCAALAYCDRLILGGHEDWRLPSVRELESLVDYGRSAPSIDLALAALPAQYWSSTTRSDVTGNAWTVHFRYGDANGDTKGVGHLVRAVRG